MRPRLSLPFTIVAEPDTIRLIAGEDMRFTLRSAGLDTWLPGLLALLDGSRTGDEALVQLPPHRHAEARELLAQLVGERVLIAAEIERAPVAGPHRIQLEGEGALRRAFDESLAAGGEVSQLAEGRGSRPAGAGGRELRVLCQDELDLHRAASWSIQMRTEGVRHLWATTGPGARALVSPVFFPDEGPCVSCLLGAFERLSPAPEISRALVAHARKGGAILPLVFSPHALVIVARLALWKLSLLDDAPAVACFALHALETRTLEVSSHPVASFEGCPVCS